MMWPEPCSRMIGSAACVTHTAPKKFVRAAIEGRPRSAPRPCRSDRAGVVDHDVELADVVRGSLPRLETASELAHLVAIVVDLLRLLQNLRVGLVLKPIEDAGGEQPLTAGPGFVGR